MNKITTLLLRHIMCISVLVCCQGPEDQSSKNTLIFAVPNIVNNFYLKESLQKNVWNYNLIFAQSLYIRNSEGALIADLAQGPPEFKNLKTEIPLKKNVFFHDNSPLTCRDVMWSYKDASHKGSPYYSAFQNIKKYECKNSILSFWIEKKNHALLERLLESIRIYKADSYPKHSESPIGSGPYMFTKSTKKLLTWTQFKKYRGPLSNNFKKLEFKVLPDTRLRFEALKQSKVDLITEWNEELEHLSKTEENIKVIETPTNSITVLGVNQKSQSCVSQKSYLHGLSAKLKKEKTELGKYFDLGLSTLNASGNTITNCTNPLFYYHKGSPASAALKRVAKTLGIKMVPRETSVFFSDLAKGRYNAFILTMSVQPQHARLFEYLHSSQVPPQKNRFFYASNSTDELLERLNKEIGPVKTRELFEKTLASLHSNPPFLIVGAFKSKIAVHKRIKIFKTNYQHTWLSALEAVKID